MSTYFLLSWLGAGAILYIILLKCSCKKDNRPKFRIETRKVNVKKATFKLTFDNGETFNITRYGHVTQHAISKPQVTTVDSIIQPLIDSHFYTSTNNPIIDDHHNPTTAVKGVLRKMELIKISDHEISFDEKVWL